MVISSTVKNLNSEQTCSKKDNVVAQPNVLSSVDSDQTKTLFVKKKPKIRFKCKFL